MQSDVQALFMLVFLGCVNIGFILVSLKLT